MGITKAQAKASKKYDEKFDIIKIRVPKGMKEHYKALAESDRKSLNQYIISCLDYFDNY